MYNIIQLNDKELSELQSIANELGIKKSDSLKKEDLVYKILDEQAIVGATKKVAADKLKEERKDDNKKKRPHDSAAKKTGKPVGRPPKNKDTAAPTKPAPAPEKSEKVVVAKTNEAQVKAPATDTPATNTPEAETTQKRRPGRPRKNPEAPAKPILKKKEEGAPAIEIKVEKADAVAEKPVIATEKPKEAQVAKENKPQVVAPNKPAEAAKDVTEEKKMS
ncbi:MAG: Rho termination factor N-terminal domain-containing protein [Mediterranea sp.]|nr:Rho termination factor N-terminal domain-containing protein [Mediterranea sp.]